MKKVWKSRALGRTVVLALALIGIALTAATPSQAFGFPNTLLAAGVVLPGYSAIADNGILKNVNPIKSERPNGFPQGRVTVVLRTEADTVYVGTESSGLFRSTDNGVTWVSLTDKLGVPMPNLTVTALAEGDDSTIYAAAGYWLGTSEAHFAALGVYVSRDGGMSWQAMTGRIPHDSIVAIVTDAEHPNVVHATTESSEDIRYVL
jgi:hypothetical protein